MTPIIGQHKNYVGTGTIGIEMAAVIEIVALWVVAVWIVTVRVVEVWEVWVVQVVGVWCVGVWSEEEITQWAAKGPEHSRHSAGERDAHRRSIANPNACAVLRHHAHRFLRTSFANISLNF